MITAIIFVCLVLGACGCWDGSMNQPSAMDTWLGIGPQRMAPEEEYYDL